MAILPTTDTQIFPTDTGAGGGLSLTTFLPSGTFTWGSISETSEKVMTLTADAGSLPAVCLFEASGDSDYFEITEIEENVLATPTTWEGTPLNVRYFSWEQGAAATLKFRPLYAGGAGSAKSMTLNVLDAEGNSIQTFDATATFTDPVTGAVTSAGNAISYWNMTSSATGSRGNTDVAAADAIGNNDLYGETGVSVTESKLTGMGDSAAIGKHIAIATGVTTDFGGSSASSGCVSRWLIVETNFTTFSGVPCEIGCGALGGYNSTLNFQVDTGICRIRNATTVKLAADPTPSGTQAYFMAIRYDGVNTNYYICNLSGSWDDAQTVSSSGNLQADGFVFNPAGTHDGVKVIPGSQHNADIGEAGLATIFRACQLVDGDAE